MRFFKFADGDLQDILKDIEADIASGYCLDADGNAKVRAFIDLLSKANSVDLSNGMNFTSWDVGMMTHACADSLVLFSWGSEDDEVAHEVSLSQKGIAEGTWDGDYFVCIDDEGEEVRLKLNRHVAITPEASNTQNRRVDSTTGDEMLRLALIATARSGSNSDADKFIEQKYLFLAPDGWHSLTPAGESALKAHGFDYDAKQGWVKVHQS